MQSVTLALIWARLRSARARPAAVVLALAAATVIPTLVSVSAAITADAALGRALAALPAGNRSAIVSYNGFLDDANAASADALARRDLPAIVDGQIRRQLGFRALADSTGQTFELAATDGLASAVRITSGRLPRSCTPTRCEVVVLATSGVRDPVVRSGYGLVIVGHAVRTDPLLLTGTFDPGPQVPVLLADGVIAASHNAPLALIQRSYGWVAPLDRQMITKLGVDDWARTATAVADRLWITRARMVLVTPDQAVRDQAARANASAQRFGLLAGGCAVLLLGSALIGGEALRPDGTRFVSALRRRGLSPNRIRAVVAGETLALAVAGALVGLLGGAVLAAVLASVAGLPTTSTTLDALRTSLPAVLGLSLGAFALLTLTLWPRTGRPEQVEERSAWRTLSGAALACLIALLLVISRGSASPGVGTDGDPLLITMPALVLLTVGLATARTWPWVVRAGYRLLPRRAVGARIGIAGIAARPLLAASTVALLAAAVGATGFAASYRSTLGRGASDQAAFQVPMDTRLSPGSGLRPVLTLASVADYRGLAPGAHAVPVVRQAGSIRSGSQTADVIQFVGLPPAALGEVRRWPTVVDGPNPDTVAQAISTPIRDRGVRLPAGKTLLIRLDGDQPEVDVTAWLRAADGRERSVPLVAQPNAGKPTGGKTSDTASGTTTSAATSGTTLTGALPAEAEAAADWSLTALAVSQPPDQATYRQHAIGESTTTRAVPSGRITLRALQVDGTSVTNPWSQWTGAGMAVDGDGGSAVLNYRLTASTVVFNARPAGLGSAQGGPLPVAADPVTAARGPLVTMSLNGVPVAAEVVAVLPRFPTVTGRFVVADAAALSSLIDQTTPGAGQPGEIWLDLPGPAAPAQAREGLAVAPFAGVQAVWAADVEHALRTDPVARGAARLLILAAGLTLLVALAALVLLVVGERVEDAGELYTWEANGVGPAGLRRSLWVRAVLVAAVGVPAGVVGGLILTRLTARLVNLTAGAAIPQPPLVAVTGLGTALPTVLIGLAAALAVSGLVALASFREPLPVLDQPSGAGR